MSLLRGVQGEIHRQTGGLFANWPPPTPIAVGDFGVVGRERFSTDGNLKDWGIAYGVTKAPKAEGKLEFKSGSEIHVGASGSGHLEVPGQKSPKGSVSVAFKGRGSFLYHLSGITTRRLKTTPEFFRSLLSTWMSREMDNDDYFAIVSEVWDVEKATIVISDSTRASFDLKGNYELNGGAILADVKGGLTVSNVKGTTINWLAKEGTLPLIGLIRPVVGPPGKGVSLGGWFRMMFPRARLAAREISIDKYIEIGSHVEKDGTAAATFSIFGSRPLALRLERTSAEQFFLTNSAEEAGQLLMVNSTEEAKEGEVRKVKFKFGESIFQEAIAVHESPQSYELKLEEEIRRRLKAEILSRKAEVSRG